MLALQFRADLCIIERTILPFRACLHEGGVPQIGKVTHSIGVKINPRLQPILPPRHPGEHGLKIAQLLSQKNESIKNSTQTACLDRWIDR